MQVAAAAQIKAPLGRFRFNAASTIGDLLIVVNRLEKEGKPPFLKFVGYSGEIEAIDVLFEDREPSGEMACTEGQESLSDPRD